MVSESKARLRKIVDVFTRQVEEQEDTIVDLLQYILDIHREHPEIPLPELGNNRFREQVWRRVTF